ncbi:hypothetical protein GWI33_017912 [Rhynchophorus ferrugineus]|uniref:Uncharacterized protein n=1 Tax=Rhynchophorus ferrugineus TaxID=354439 RepID=A0A834HYB5_RHYFE|nr:hypothetical protein GWI33_017912 [Rhynchophorus ferrugineus]
MSILRPQTTLTKIRSGRSSDIHVLLFGRTKKSNPPLDGRSFLCSQRTSEGERAFSTTLSPKTSHQVYNLILRRVGWDTMVGCGAPGTVRRWGVGSLATRRNNTEKRRATGESERGMRRSILEAPLQAVTVW